MDVTEVSDEQRPLCSCLWPRCCHLGFSAQFSLFLVFVSKELLLMVATLLLGAVEAEENMTTVGLVSAMEVHRRFHSIVVTKVSAVVDRRQF